MNQVFGRGGRVENALLWFAIAMLSSHVMWLAAARWMMTGGDPEMLKAQMMALAIVMPLLGISFKLLRLARPAAVPVARLSAA